MGPRDVLRIGDSDKLSIPFRIPVEALITAGGEGKKLSIPFRIPVTHEADLESAVELLFQFLSGFQDVANGIWIDTREAKPFNSFPDSSNSSFSL